MRKYLTIFIAGILACIAFGYLLTFLFNRNQMYEYNVRGKSNNAYTWDNYLSFLLTSKQVNAANEILSGLNYDEYAEKSDYFTQEANNLEKYKKLILEDKADIKINETDRDYIIIDGTRYYRDYINEITDRYEAYYPEMVDEQILNFRLSSASLRYALEYEQYVQYVIENSKKLSGIKVFNENTRNDIKSKGNDYEELTDVKIKAHLTAGFEKLIDNPFGDLMALLMVIISASIVVHYMRKTEENISVERRGNTVFKAIFVLGLGLLILGEIAAINYVFPVDGLRNPIQTVPRFKTCTLNISIGLFLVIRTLIKSALYYVLFLALELALLKKKYRTIIVISALLVLLEITLLKGTPCDLLNVVRLEKTLYYSYKEILIFIAITSFLLLILILVFELRYYSYMSLERERAEQKYLADINEKYNEMRTIKHDMNNHLAAILFLMDEGKNDEAKKYIRELTGVTSKTANIRKTGMKALDLLLWNKVSLASTKNIDIEMQLDDEYSEISISEYEMCSMFANIIDNAIEAVEKLKTLDRDTKETSGDEKKESRKIILRTSRQMEMMCVFCENPYAETKKENGNFVSTKKDAENHGLGLKQIRRIAEKHGGTMNIDDRDGVFRLSVIMNV